LRGFDYFDHFHAHTVYFVTRALYVRYLNRRTRSLANSNGFLEGGNQFLGLRPFMPDM